MSPVSSTAFAVDSPLSGQRLVSLRPVGEHALLRRMAGKYAMTVVALSPWALVQRDEPATCAALDLALQADVVVVTSPAAVKAACRLRALRARSRQVWVAVGAGTAQRLEEAGVGQVVSPEQMDSEGLLALPVLQALDGQRVGLITAPGGRGLIAPTLAQRGATVVRADVYARVPVSPAPAAVARLATPGPLWLALSSQAALDGVLERLPQAARQRLRDARVVAASQRLAHYALDLGWDAPIIARDARPMSLLEAIVATTA